MEDKIDFSAGLAIRAKHGQSLGKGDILAEFYSDRPTTEDLKSMIANSFKISCVAPAPFPLIGERLS